MSGFRPDGFVAGLRLEIAGAPSGPLAGLSFAAKDLFDVAGHVTGCGNAQHVHLQHPERSEAIPLSETVCLSEDAESRRDGGLRRFIPRHDTWSCQAHQRAMVSAIARVQATRSSTDTRSFG